MSALAPTTPLPADRLQELYGYGYFHGVGSGFAAEGYERVHATWAHWMPFVEAELGRGARWCDLGCAYGFLVAEAREAGFRALGFDASRFAVGEASRHAHAAGGTLGCAHAERLPVGDATIDVVTAFDLLEHVPEPALVIAEAARVLRRGGLLIAATPDPMLFDRAEPTHIAERVPAWWVRSLEDAGFEVALRFFQAPYNLELVARKEGPAPQVGFDALGVAEPIVELCGEGALRVALRSGFGAYEGGVRVMEDGAVVYLLNASRAPLTVDLDASLAEPAALEVTLDGRIVGRGARARFLLPAGGHSLRLAVAGGWTRLEKLRLVASRAPSEELCATLPFDLHERYALAARVKEILSPGSARMLDIGGTIGGDGGHLAWSGDFFPGVDLTVVDRRPADYPEHVAAEIGGRLPFADRAFDVVNACDVLEHVPPDAREGWLAEVWRLTGRWCLLAGPFATPGVAEADRYLFELIRARYGYEHAFLAEHLAFGHPELEATCDFFRRSGASVTVLPAGYLPAWVLMQTVNAWLSHPRQDASYALANASFNRAVGLASSVEPAYRHLLVIDRSGVPHEAELAGLVRATPPDLPALHAALAALPSGPGVAGEER